MGEKLIIFMDFDGTISREDVCNKMAARYAGRDWEEIRCLRYNRKGGRQSANA